MNRLLLIFIVTISLLVAADGACEQELQDLNACIDDDCQTCLAVDGVAWTSCSELNMQYCDLMEECSEPCASCMSMYQVWATCYVDSLTHVDDCQLVCDDGSGRMDEMDSSAPIIMAEYILAFSLVVAFVAV